LIDADYPACLPGWQSLFEMGEKLATLSSIAAQKDLIIQTTKSTLAGEVSLWLSPPSPPLPGTDDMLFVPEPRTPLMERVFTSGSREVEYDSSSQHLSAVAVPIQTQNMLIGILQVSRSDPPLSSGELQQLDALAAHAAFAAYYGRQVAIKNWRFEQINLVRSVSFQISHVMDLDELARRVTDLILKTFNYYYVAIFTLDEGEGVLHFRASACSVDSEIPDKRTHMFPVTLGDGIVGHVAQTGEELVACRVSEEPRFRYVDTLPETQSEIALPLKIENRILGVLDIQSNKADAFHDMDMLVLHALADNISLAIEGAQLYQWEQRRADQISYVAEISRVVTSILDMDQLLKEVALLIHKRFGYSYVHVFTVHPGRRKILFQAGSGARSLTMQTLGINYELDSPTGIIPWVARNGETIMANDVTKDPYYRPTEISPIDTCAELTIPLKNGGEVLGILDIQSTRCNAFDENDRQILETLADNIAVAIRNATLYRSERWRRQVAESLRDVAGLLSANAALDDVLDSILTELERNLPCDVAGIWLVQDATNELPHAGTNLRLAAIHGSDKKAVERIRLINPEVNTWLSQAAQSQKPTIRRPQDPLGPLGLTLDFPQDYSSIVAPLRTGEKFLGVISLAHRTNGRYGGEALAMTTTFASYAAVAIENTRLFASSQEQAWVSTVLLQVSEATQSITDIDELIATVVRLTPLLAGFKGCAIFLWDEKQSTFSLNAAYGSHPLHAADLSRKPFYPEQIPAFEQLFQLQTPVFITDPCSELKLSPSAVEEMGLNALLLLPLMSHSELLGAFLITYDPAVSGAENEDGEDEHLAIIQGIAHQTATAIQNTRLLDAKQEEAYVTAVLLQVAQTVVSNENLEDTLESIVHIMPILVGIDYCLIYLWNDSLKYYEAAHVYAGSARVEHALIGKRYGVGEFPVLDSVLEQEIPLHYYLPSGIAPADWPEFARPRQAEKESPSIENAGLLAAFPLFIKGDRYGVMLAITRESARLTERRMEILSGIAQQTSLAIQNSRLQIEMMVRERMEREFQLAREIQQKFLPDRLPRIPGWEMDARWQTAREVGGDFYDIIELPDHRFGLVIADVSDKGMPAALYMTVSRTLIRATVKDFNSPARVLETVNNLLLMNSEDGMLVTVFYAILSPRTGKIIYANAGHNLPVILHAETGETELLEKGGITLGALEQIHLTDHTTVLNPGDVLVMYTDGLTESNSPDGRFFGEEGLCAVMKEQVGMPVNDTLAKINTVLDEFRNHTPPADDTTLLAIRRLP